MKNKYTILLTILCIISSCIYINRSTYDNKNSDFIINVSEYDNNLHIENNELNKNSTNINTLDVDKTENNIQNSNELININIADKETLKTLPNIGDTLAENIINYRENISLFYDISDIKKVDRIGVKTYEKIKNLITVD